MTKKRSTKSTLLMSALSLLLCVSMLVGTTFAWFTDEVTSGKNQIIAGNLDIELEYSKDMSEGSWQSVEGKTDIVDPLALWEPGRTEVVYLRISNLGTLALKYNFSINFEDTVVGKSVEGNDIFLSEYLKYAVVDVTEKFADRDAARDAVESVAGSLTNYSVPGTMEKGDAAKVVALVIYMPEEVGNEANYRGENIPQIDMGIKLIAIQKDAESDSFGPDYDANLDPVVDYLFTGKGIHQSTTSSGKFALSADIKTSDYGDDARYGWGYEYIIRGGADYILDLNGKTLTHDTVNENANKNAFTYTFVANNPGTKLTINGEGTIYANNSEGYTCAIQGKDGTLITINGGTYQVDNGIAVWAGAGSHIIINGGTFVNGNSTTDHELIYSSGGVIDIYGGFFHNTEGNYTLNIEDRNRATGFINVYGGTFVNFDPSTGGQDPNNIKVANGYKVVSETQENGDVWYTVVPNLVDNADDLITKLGNGESVMLNADIALTESIIIPADVKAILNLNGHTISQENVQTAAYAMITVKGTLTISDSVGTGKISYADVTAYTSDPGWASNTIRNEGTLIINGGTIENITSDEVMSYGYPHAIDAYQGSVTTINGGTVKSLNYDSIRMFCNSETLATTVTINGGTIINRISFQDPAASRAGYGVLTINGGEFITTDGVNANVRLLNFSNKCNNMKAVVTGGTFDKGFKTQNYSSADVKTSDWLTYMNAVPVVNATELQAALDNAVDGTAIKLLADITGDVTATQQPNVKVTIDGNGKTFAGVIVVDGKSGTYTTAGLTIQNLIFKADSISADACIRLGDGTNATRYTCNVTVSNCTFDVPGAVGVKSYTGGDKNLTITGCTATANAHSLVQAKGIDGILVEECKVYSKNGMNFNNSDNVTVSGCTVDVKGYAVRFGESSGGAGAAETYLIKGCALKSACDDGDAVIILRGTADYATLTIENTTIEGTIEITNTATGATVVK